MTNKGGQDASGSTTPEDDFRLAVEHHQAGRLTESVQCYRRVLEVNPAHAVANHNLGTVAVQMGEPAIGLPYFLAALEADPTQGKYWTSYIDALARAGRPDDARQMLALARQQGLQSNNEVVALAAHLTSAATPDRTTGGAMRSPHKGKGPKPNEINALVGLFNQGRGEEAAAMALALTRRYPRHPFGWKALGTVLKSLKRLGDALPPMKKAVELAPRDAEAYANLGAIFHDLGRLDEAEQCYSKALVIDPNYADAHFNRAVTLKKQCRLAEAEASYLETLRIDPAYVDAHTNLGIVLYELGRLDEAEASYRHALAIDPNYAIALNGLAIALKDQRRLEEAEAACRRALAIIPNYVEALGNLGVILHELGRLAEAEACYRSALEISPTQAAVLCNQGAILHNLKRLDEAEACYRKAIALEPDLAAAYHDLGNTMKGQERIEEARACFRRAYELGIRDARVKEALMLPAIMGTREEMLASRAEFERKLDQLVSEGVEIDNPLKNIGETNFYLAYHGINDRDVQTRLAKFYERACPSLLYVAPHCTRPIAQVGRRMRVGFLSQFLYLHSVSLCFSKIIEALSVRGPFEVALISSQAIDEKLYADFAGVKLRLPYDLEHARLAVAALELDVLIYLDIGMEPLSYFLAFSRLAPVQCVLGGHPVTTGIGNVDYFISAAPQEPVGAEAHYSERLILPSVPLAYFERPILPKRLKTRAEMHLPVGLHLYMCPMKLQKLHPDFDEAMVEILRLDKDGVIVLFEDDVVPYWRGALEKRFERTIPAELRQRVTFLPWISNREDFVSVIAAADVLLDPFPFGMGSTAATIAVTGTPMVTKPGEFMRGRIGAYYCSMFGLAECITRDTRGYARKAVEIATDKLLRDRLGTEMMRNGSILYDNLDAVDELADFLMSLRTDTTEADSAAVRAQLAVALRPEEQR